MTDEDKINEALKDIQFDPRREEVTGDKVSLRPNGRQVTDIERLMNTGERLLREQQDRLVGEKANYEEGRVNMLNAYAASLAKLERQTADALHRLQQDHQGRTAEIERLIVKLKALREA
jgi:hypothetical protein